MKAITIPPLEAWALAEGLTRFLSYNRRTEHRGDILIGAPSLTPEAIERYTDWWCGGGEDLLSTPNYPHPVAWAKDFPGQSYLAIGKLVEIAPFDRLYNDGKFDFSFMRRRKWIMVFEQVEKLDEPLRVRQDAGIREFDLEKFQTRRIALAPDQVHSLYVLCRYLEGIGNSRREGWRSVENHFIFQPEYVKLRRALFKKDASRYLLRRLIWRRVFARSFPDYQPEGT